MERDTMSKKRCDVSELPLEAVEYIVKLRQEAARARTQRNAARRDANAAIERIAELHAELDALR
jgi:DNA-binding protein H-NS